MCVSKKSAELEDNHRHNEDVLSRCKEGDLLQFPRGKYSHWAVYSGDQKVIHLSGDNDGIGDNLRNPRVLGSPSGVKLDKAKIKEDSFWDVVENSLAKINNYLDKRRVTLSGREIVERARGKLGEVGYNVLVKNCEHFATWCRYGKKFSLQAALAWSVGIGVIVGVVTLPAALIVLPFYALAAGISVLAAKEIVKMSS